MTTTTVKEQITKAIAAHGLWKGRLRQAVQTRSSELNVESVSRDNNCEFGKWLQANPAFAAQWPQHYRNACRLHTEFHREVGRVLQMALSGNRQEAEKQLAPGTPYSQLSSSLTNEMMAWAGELR